MSHDNAAIVERRRRIQTTDFDVAVTGLRGLYGDVRADVRTDFEWRADVADLGPVTFIRGACTAGFALDFAPHSHVLTVPVHNAQQARAPGGSAEIAPARAAALFSPGIRSGLKSSSDMRVVTVRIDPGFLMDQLEALTGATVKRSIQFDVGLRTDAGPGGYVERLCRFIASEIESGGLAMHPAAVTGQLESLARALLTGQRHDYTSLLERPAPPSSRTMVRQVEEYVDAHAGEPIRAADLAALTGEGVRSLEAAFQQHRGTTPAAFVRARRLERARRTLLEDPRASLPHVAQAAGFLRQEPFEAAYFRAFQESPADTRRRGAVPSPPSSPSAPPATADRLVLLSRREREVAELVARGMLNKQIAAELGIAEQTVKIHRGAAMKKLGLGSAAELGRLFARLTG